MHHSISAYLSNRLFWDFICLNTMQSFDFRPKIDMLQYKLTRFLYLLVYRSFYLPFVYKHQLVIALDTTALYLGKGYMIFGHKHTAITEIYTISLLDAMQTSTGQ